MIVSAPGRLLAPSFIDMSVLFDQMSRTMKSSSNMLQHRAALINPTLTPRLFIDPQSVRGAIEMNKSGMMLNVQA